MTERMGSNPGETVCVSREFELTEFKLARFYCIYFFFSFRGVQITQESECLQFINAFEISAKDAVPMEVECFDYCALKPYCIILLHQVLH